MKTEQELQDAGFTPGGRKRYLATVEAYSQSLFEKAVTYGKVDKADDTPLEITQENVRAAAHNIVSIFGKDKPSMWNLPIQIGEHVFTALAGVGGGKLDARWGIALFVISIAIAVILFVVRNTVLKQS